MSRRITAALTAAAVTMILATGGASGHNGPGQQPPSNVTPPSINGTAQVPDPLSATNGTWQGRGLRYAYQWLRCDSAGANCNAISGATSSAEALSNADVGSTLRAIVTASNRNGSAASTSAPTDVVRPPDPPPPPPPPPAGVPPTDVTPPTASGTAQQGQTLTGGTGTWSGSTPITYAYQWQRCDSAGASCAAISGATAANYALVAADVGQRIRVSVAASNSYGSTAAASDATEVVGGPPPPPPPPPPSGYYNHQGFEGVLASDLVYPWAPGWGSNSNTQYTFNPTHLVPAPGFSGQGIGLRTDANGNETSAWGGGSSTGLNQHNLPGDGTWYRVKMKFRSPWYPAGGNWDWLMEWHTDPTTAAYSTAFGVYYNSVDTTPTLVVRLAGGDATNATFNSTACRAAPGIQVDHWYDLVAHVVWDTVAANAGGSGLFEYWIDGTRLCSVPFPTLYHRGSHIDRPGYGVYNYHSATYTTPRENDFDENYIGPTAASVGFAP